MSQVVILGKTSAHLYSLIAIATEHATRVIIHTVAEIQLSFRWATLLSLIPLARRRAL